MRVMRLSERFSLPIICLIDTPGAYPGIGAEERGQALAIAENIRDMFYLTTPIIVTIIGEGGSGGALGIGVGDRVLVMEYAYYSVISPEGCAAILWKDASERQEAAKALRLTAPELLNLGIIDEIIPEPEGGAHRNYELAAKNLKDCLLKNLDDVTALDRNTLLKQRYAKYRKIGMFQE
jgi:acetyl-CoA carboxylase carboxyl transferase subunit alpha